jgi:hypothetical protein
MRSIALTPLLRHSAILALGTFLCASSAWADPVTVFFDGVNHEGMSEQSALDSGLQILTGDTFAALGVIDVTSQVGADGVVVPPADATNPFAITSAWTIESLMSVSVIGNPYLLFATAEDRTLTFDPSDPSDDFTTSYNPSEVGLTVDASDGWAIVQGESGGQAVYYVGISLGDLLDAVGSTTVVDVNYFLLQAFPDNAVLDPNDPDMLDEILALPQLDLLVAFNVVPEPGTGLLVGLGLLGLAGSRHRRT